MRQLLTNFNHLLKIYFRTRLDVKREKIKEMNNSDFHKTSQKDLVSTSFKFDSLICSACCNYFDRKEQFTVIASPGDNVITCLC